LLEVDTLIEKPGEERAPSQLATVSGSIFTPDIFEYVDQALANLTSGAELYYNDLLKLMLRDKKRILAAEIKGGKYYDTGNKLEYLKTVIEFALENKELNGDFREYLKTLKI